MDVVGIIVSVVIFIILVAVSFYLFAIYCHRNNSYIAAEDKGIGSSLGSKILIVFCQALAWGQLLLIPLDVQSSLSAGSIDSVMYIVYSVVYIIIFAFVAWIIPFTIFLYETD